MLIEHDFIEVMSVLSQQSETATPDPQQIISVIDYTLLDKQANLATIQLFQSQINMFPVAAVCAYPEHLQQLTIPGSIRKATVVNFPDGLQSLTTVCEAIDKIANQVDEIDYVFPQNTDGHDKHLQALKHCEMVFQHCRQHQLTFKVILETGAMHNAETIMQLSRQIIAQGCDFIKTSTGKTPIGATPLAAFAILKAIQDSESTHCGLKVSGGIKQIEQAWFYLRLAEYCLQKPAHAQWFRIGTSSLLVLKQEN